MLLSFAVLALLVVAAGVALGVRSQGIAPDTGLRGGILRGCPDTPNCVCSENGTDRSHAVAPLKFSGMPAEAAWRMLRSAIEQAGGMVVTVDDHYLHATFTSRLFRFVDDVEARLDVESGTIQLRSASRVGHSDLGANRKRIEAIRAAWAETRSAGRSDPKFSR